MSQQTSAPGVEPQLQTDPRLQKALKALAAERQARLDAEVAAYRARLLANASVLLESSLDYQTTLANVARMALQHFADWCSLQVLDENGILKEAAAAHSEATQDPLLRKALRYPPAPPALRGASAVLRTGCRQLIGDVPLALLQELARDAEHLQLLRDLHLRSLIIVPLRVEDRLLGTLTFVRTSSTRRYTPADGDFAEELARRAALAIDHSLQHCQVRDGEQRKNEFLATLAHELRNPLAPICHALQIMRMSTAVDTNLQRAREIVERQVGHMARLIDDLLDVARVQSGKIDLRRVRLDLNAVINDAVEAVTPALRARSHQLTVELPPHPLELNGDPTRLEQVVVNLLSNACKYTPPGGKIHVGVRAENEEVVLRVKDSGLGIAPEMLSRVFELFTQANQSMESSQGGLGIGLTLVQHLVELHGGTVTAHSEGLGKGSEFIVRLPVSTEPLAQGALVESQSTLIPPPDVRPKQVLIVEDNDDCRDSLSLVLSSWGHTVTAASGGIEGVELAKAQPPQIALIDLAMPGIDGYEVARRIRAALGRKVLLVALTGYGQPADRSRTRGAGFDTHLTKPASLEDLARVVGGAVRIGA